MQGHIANYVKFNPDDKKYHPTMVKYGVFVYADGRISALVDGVRKDIIPFDGVNVELPNGEIHPIKWLVYDAHVMVLDRERFKLVNFDGDELNFKLDNLMLFDRKNLADQAFLAGRSESSDVLTKLKKISKGVIHGTNKRGTYSKRRRAA